MPDDLVHSSRLNVAPRVTLFVAAPLAAQSRLCRAFAETSIKCVETSSGILEVSFSIDRLQHIGLALSQSIADSDRAKTRCRMLPQGSALDPVQLMHSQPLDDFLGWVAGQWLRDLLAQQQLVTYFQPIVYCSVPQVLFAHECLTRGLEIDGQIISADRMFSAARISGQLADLDRAAQLTAIATVARLGIGETVFINLNPHSILDAGDCVEGSLRAVLDLRLDPQQFVFEVVESDRIVDGDQLLRALEQYREAGFRVALDDLGAGCSSLNLLGEVKPDFVKVDRKQIHGIEHDDYKAQVAAKMLELARDLGVPSVVEGVETFAQWQWCRDHGADFAQGYYFAHPMPTPASRGCQCLNAGSTAPVVGGDKPATHGQQSAASDTPIFLSPDP